MPPTGNSEVVNWSLEKKKTNLRLTEKDLQRPFGFDLPIRFYERVKGTAVEMGISQKQLVSRAVDDFIEEQRKERRRAALPATVKQEQLVRRAGSLRWKNVTVEQRRKMMQRISQARWGTKKKAKKPQGWALRAAILRLISVLASQSGSKALWCRFDSVRRSPFVLKRLLVVSLSARYA